MVAEVRPKPGVFEAALSIGQGPNANGSVVQVQFPIKCLFPAPANTREGRLVQVRVKPSVLKAPLSIGRGLKANGSVVRAQFPIKCLSPALVNTRERV